MSISDFLIIQKYINIYWIYPLKTTQIYISLARSTNHIDLLTLNARYAQSFITLSYFRSLLGAPSISQMSPYLHTHILLYICNYMTLVALNIV